LEQDAPYLAAANLYAHLLGGLGQGVQGPVGRLGLVEGFRWQAIVAEKPSGWVLGNQGDDPGTLLLGDAGFPSGTGAVAETVYPFGVEAVEAPSHGLRMTAEFFGDPGGAQSLPTQGDDTGSEDPVAGSVAAAGEFADFSFFFDVFG
jgi:hypothetical protein